MEKYILVIHDMSEDGEVLDHEFHSSIKSVKKSMREWNVFKWPDASERMVIRFGIYALNKTVTKEF